MFVLVLVGGEGFVKGCYVVSVYMEKAKVRLNFYFLANVKSLNFTMQEQVKLLKHAWVFIKS